MRTLILSLALMAPGAALACGGGSCPLGGPGTALAAGIAVGIGALLSKFGLFQ